jgi:hypothetical protein
VSGMEIHRSLTQLDRSGEISFGDTGGIRISATTPFSGGAEYLPQRGNGGSWSGTLKGAFPGIGAVPLAGSSFSALRRPE